jgi:uncharacterized membrane protein YjgN (DUF898 family)
MESVRTAVDVAERSLGAPVIQDATPAPVPPPPGRGAARFVGRDPVYWRLMIRGAVLLLCTLGIYRFWLATDQRRFLWGDTEIAGDALEYIGSARELLVGFLIAIAVLVPIYAGFFLAALASGLVGALSGVAAFVLLALFGHFAIYRARRYRLTRTVFRGLRLHQSGSAWRYAIYSMFWWVMTFATFGLAYPWAQATLERYKMRNTFYGDLRGGFAGSGTRLFLRGILLWALVVGPILVGSAYAVRAINWSALAEAVDRGGDNVLGRIESVSPNFDAALAFVSIAALWSVVAAGVLYPVFQAMVLRWWTSGLRFGEITVRSKLRTVQMYGLYLRFVGYLMVFVIVIGLVSAVLIPASNLLMRWLATAGDADSTMAEFGGLIGPAISYLVAMLGYSTIYQVTVKLRLWALSFETAEFTGLEALDGVRAAGVASSAFGEGLADALDIGGL